MAFQNRTYIRVNREALPDEGFSLQRVEVVNQVENQSFQEEHVDLQVSSIADHNCASDASQNDELVSVRLTLQAKS